MAGRDGVVMLMLFGQNITADSCGKKIVSTKIPKISDVKTMKTVDALTVIQLEDERSPIPGGIAAVPQQTSIYRIE